MARTFIGKTIPAHSPQAIPNREMPAPRLRRAWLGIALSCCALVGLAGASLSSVSFSPQSRVDSDAASASTVLASVPRLLADAPAETGEVAGTTDTYNPGACNGISAKPTAILPLLDAKITDKNGCNPTNWNLNVIILLLNKAVFILNWFAGVAAICLTVYAGLLYISGFANEANVKKAKTLLIVAYTGLLIVFTARIILLGFAGTLATTSSNTTIQTQLQNK